MKARRPRPPSFPRNGASMAKSPLVFPRFALPAAVFCLILAKCAFPDPYWVFFERSPGWSPGDPVPDEAVRRVVGSGCALRTVSRYFDAVSVDFDGDPEALARIEGVESVRPVRRLVRADPARPEKGPERFPRGRPRCPGGTAVPPPRGKEAGGHVLDYGYSRRQLEAMNIPALHDMGLTGAGVLVGVLDTGFDIGDTGCLGRLDILAGRNFITGGGDVSGNHHGVHVLACLAGAQEGKYYGPAFGASFLLAVTDDYLTETRADEDRWVAAVEWCDSLGADIISSSLVYNLFDSAEESYSKEDMDGRTSLVARAAETAAARGIVVVNSAGNEGDTPWRMITTPADAEHVIAVGAVSLEKDGGLTVADFSSRGPTADGRIKPDVAAPGENVYVPYPGTSDFFYAARGTSLAAPLVAGLCALLLERHPEWGPAEVMSALKETATDLGAPGPDNDYGWGVPDGVRALDYAPLAAHRAEPAASRAQPFTLLEPYPNPFNAAVAVPLAVRSPSRVTVRVFDSTGRVVETLMDGLAAPGFRLLTWNGAGRASGVYFVRVSAGSSGRTKKMTLVR